MTLQQMKYLSEISKTGSISRAAQNLYMTQPSLSKAIVNLEQELAIEIFERTSRGIQFTPEGSELLGYAKQMLEQAETIKSRFAQKSKGDSMRFSVSAQHYAFTVDAFITLLQGKMDKNFELHLREGKTSEVIEDVFSQKSEIGVIFLSSSSDRLMRRILNDKGITFNNIKTLTPHVFVGMGHPLAAQQSVTLSQLEPYPCITYEQGHDSFGFAEEVVSVGRRGQVVYVRDRATTNNLIKHTTCYNIGTGCLLTGINDDGIISISIADYFDHMNLGWIMLKNHAITPEISEYVSYMHESIEKCYCGWPE